jgi:hypothetical protein
VINAKSVLSLLDPVIPRNLQHFGFKMSLLLHLGMLKREVLTARAWVNGTG